MQIRNEELSSSDTSSDEGEIKLKDLTAEELEAAGLCSLFSYDDNHERKYQSEQKLNTRVLAGFTNNGHGDATAISTRDKYMAYLNQERQSDYYQSLQAKLDNKEKLLAREYYYYAMTTDNVNKLDVTALKRMTDTYHIQNLDANLRVLIAAREWQNATDPAIKQELNVELSHALKDRGYMRTSCEMYLNLHGIDLSGADLSMVSLDYTDLGSANLSRANLYSTEMHLSNLDQANLSDADCVRPDLKGRMEDAPNIRLSTARNACFDGMIAPSLDWRESDFTGSSFKNAKIGYGIFSATIFDHCDFSNSDLAFSDSNNRKCSLKFANLMNTELVHADYASLDLTGAQLMPYTAFSDAQSLCAALDIINADVMEKLRTLDTSEWHRTSQINSFQKIMAENIIFHLGHLSFSHMSKAFIIEAALDHDLFSPEKYLQQLAFRAERNIYSLFSNQTHESYATEAVKMLETARDSELQEDNMMRMN